MASRRLPQDRIALTRARMSFSAGSVTRSSSAQVSRRSHTSTPPAAGGGTRHRCSGMADTSSPSSPQPPVADGAASAALLTVCCCCCSCKEGCRVASNNQLQHLFTLHYQSLSSEASNVDSIINPKQDQHMFSFTWVAAATCGFPCGRLLITTQHTGVLSQSLPPLLKADTLSPSPHHSSCILPSGTA